jgi:AraC-like DNA-binding protein/ligand-binding sensor protein
MRFSDGGVLGQLTRSQIYHDYEQAFSMATELPLTLRPVEMWSLAHKGKSHQNPFCSILAESNKGCAACLEVQEKIGASNATGATSTTCFAGLNDTAVPVHIGKDLVGFLQTGQVAFRQPTAKKFKQISKKLLDWGTGVDLRRLEDAYFHSKVISPKQYAGVVRLLEIFATHLSALGNQLSIQESTTESPFSRRAKAYVADHQTDPITLEEVSRALHVSTFYFCKMFKKATGLTFTDYLGRVRIERSKNLLLDPNRRISEVAYEVGFGSLTHFNRVFRKLVGQSPSDYRENLPQPK